MLTEAERGARWRARARAVAASRGLGGRTVTHLPSLAHTGNFAPAQDDETRQAGLGTWLWSDGAVCRFHKRVTVEAECIICMDTERDCLLSPCCHLATCQVQSVESRSVIFIYITLVIKNLCITAWIPPTDC